jgi:hypothetical protein
MARIEEVRPLIFMEQDNMTLKLIEDGHVEKVARWVVVRLGETRRLDELPRIVAASCKRGERPQVQYKHVDYLL